MDLFDRAMSQVKKFEGGYVNNPADRGKETFRGVSRKSWPDWAGWPFIDAAKGEWANLPAKGKPKLADFINSKFRGSAVMDDLETAFYRDNFWDEFAPCLSGRILWKVFDTGINNGIPATRKLLQKALNMAPLNSKLAVDGVIGPKTRAAASRVPQDALLTNFCRAQADRYRAIVKDKPDQKQFLNGWLNRAAWVPPKGDA
jgi:lysozyme family protein